MSPPISAFSSRKDGNMSLKYGDTNGALENRRVFLKGLGIDSGILVCAEQTHSSNVWYAKKNDMGKGALDHQGAIPDTDALITDEKRLPLAVFTADCLSVFLFDPHRPAVGIIHAGWRSTKANITTKTVQLMQEKFNTCPSDLSVRFGPAIRACCYHLDLAALNKKELLDLGVKQENIFDAQICTACRNKEFFSYQQEKDAAGRMISVIMLL